MDALEALLQELKDVIAEIEELEQSAPGEEDVGALDARLDQLRIRKEALDEEINQVTGAAR